MTTPVDRLAEALKDRYTLERELGTGSMALTAEWRNGGTAERGFDA